MSLLAIGLALRGRTFSRPLAASAVALWVIAIASIVALADALPDSTWVALGSLPHQGATAIFALAVDPSNNEVLLAGNSEGSLLKSANGGATWNVVHAGRFVVTTIAYSSNATGLVLAGTRGGGALVSRDGGTSWSAAVGLEGRVVHVFAFSLTTIAAGTDKGVFLSPDGGAWSQSTLSNRSIDAIAVEAIHAPVRFVAGSDGQVAGSVPLYQSLDSGSSWTTLTPPIAGTTVVKLAAGPLPPIGTVRPLVVGTNTGLFLSSDNAANFAPLSGGALLPTTDYTQVAFVADHFDKFYAASDGGGSQSGGIWRTDDGGQSFRSLQPPQPSLTALAVSNDQDPVLYVAIFQPTTHAASLWAYHDTGGPPQGPGSSSTAVVSATRKSPPTNTSALQQILGAPQLPYIGLGLGALAVVLTAVVAHVRGRYR